MEQPKFHHYHSSHREHILYAGIILLIGVLVGYGVGSAYESERLSEETFGQVGNMVIKKVSKNVNRMHEQGVVKKFNSSILDISFQYPGDTVYKETDMKSDFLISGHILRLHEINEKGPLFYVYTSDIKDKLDNSYSWESALKTDMSSASNLQRSLQQSNGEYNYVSTVSEGQYLAVTIGSPECSAIVSAMLIVRAPKLPFVHSIKFELGARGLSSAEKLNDCSGDPQKNEATAHAYILNSAVQKNLQAARAIAESFDRKQ